MMEQADVLVIGGGIMGAASAFFLRRRGLSVILVEHGLIGQQASGVNFGNVRRHGRPADQMELSNRSHEIWARLPELVGEDCEFLRTGHLRVGYDEADASALEAYAASVASFGLDLEILGSRSLHQRFSFVGARAAAASFSPHCAHANPRLTAPAFGRAARREGVLVIENTECSGFEKRGDDFEVTSSAGRTFRAPVLLVTAGAWAGEIAGRFGEGVPLVVKGPQMGVTEPMPYALGPVVGVYTRKLEEMLYFRQIERGNIVFGGGGRGFASAQTRRSQVDPSITLNQFKQLRGLVPALGRLRLIRVWSGIESYLPDDCQVMGASEKVPGLFYAFGFCGHGFQLGPGVGATMAELIATGSTSFSLRPFAVGRFARAARQGGAETQSRSMADVGD